MKFGKKKKKKRKNYKRNQELGKKKKQELSEVYTKLAMSMEIEVRRTNAEIFFFLIYIAALYSK